MNGIVGTGAQYRTRGLDLLRQSAELNQRNKEENELADQGKEAQIVSSTISGALFGAQMGAAAGPVGIIGGAIAGNLLGRIF